MKPYSYEAMQREIFESKLKKPRTIKAGALPEDFLVCLAGEVSRAIQAYEERIAQLEKDIERHFENKKVDETILLTRIEQLKEQLKKGA